MASLNFMRDNWGTSSFSFFPSYVTSEPNPNCGISPTIVMVDPLGDTQVSPGTTPTEIEFAEKLKRRVRRELMSGITSEFTTWNDELLRKLAR